MSEFTEKIKELNKSFLTEVRKLISVEFVKTFAENPMIKSVTWDQFTPYFNDGSPCVFSVNSIYDDSLEFDEALSDEDFYSVEDKAMSDFGKILNSIPEQIMRAVFGDHARVKATKEGFEISKYTDHY